MTTFIRNIYAAFFRLACLYILSFSSAAAQPIVGFSIANASVTEKDTFSISFSADSILTGKNIYSFRFGLSFNADDLEFISLEPAGTILGSWGLPSFNNKTAGRIFIAGAGTSPLSGSGEMFTLIFRAKRGGASYVQNTAGESYLNEGSPGMTLKSGYIQSAARSYPNISPDSYTLYVGDELQMNVSGGTPPYVYNTADTTVAVISGLNKVRAKAPGLSKVFVTDAAGEVSHTTGFIDVRAIKLSILRSTAWPGESFLVPVKIEIAPGTKVYSGSFELEFNTNIAGISDSALQGDFPVTIFNKAYVNRVTISFASTSGFTGSGIVCYIGFKALKSGTHSISLKNALFDETLLAMTYNESAQIYSLPVLTISPNGGSMMWGNTQKITVSNGTPPISFMTSDTAIAGIDALGNLYGKTGGKVKVTATDTHGAKVISNDFLIYHNRFSVSNTEGELDKDTRVPVTTTMMPEGSALFGFEGNISFNTTHMEFVRMEPGVPGMIVESVVNGGTVSIVGASGSGITNGLVCFAIFRLKNTLELDQQTDVTLSNFIANESSIYSTMSGGKVKRVAQVSYRPVAVAGANIRVNEGTTAFLDGSASYDDDNDPLTFSWTSPPGIQLNDSTLVKPQFIAPFVDVNTNYTFTLIVSDGKADSDPSYVTVTVIQLNKPPVADAGPDRSYREGTSISLDGSASYDPDGESISFQWTSLDQIVLFDAKSESPSFIAPQVSVDTKYRFRLIVSDGVVFSAPDTVTITVLQVNKKPVAFAGGDQTVNEGETVYLDGSLSSDPDGDPITYLWTAPEIITLSSYTVPKPFFTAPPVHRDSTLTLSLVVNDGVQSSEPDNIVISVKNVDILSEESQILLVELASADSIHINQTTRQILLYLPYGYDITSLSPVFTISDKAGINPRSGTSHNFKNPVAYTVTAEDGTTTTTYQVQVYVPDLNLSILLNAGWNWVSLSVDPPAKELDQVFAGLMLATRDYVKSGIASSVYYTGTGWFGDLGSVPDNEFVKLKIAGSQTWSLAGKEVNPVLRNIPVTTGWNRIGYLLKFNTSLNSSFNEATLPSGELLLKSRDASAVYYPATGWVGDLDSLKVLNGYMLKAASNSNIRYNPGGAGRKTMQIPASLFQRSELHKIYNLKAFNFEHSLNLICEIVNDKGENITQKGDLLIASMQGDFRGVTEASYIPDIERYLFLLTVFSNTGSEFSLQLKSLENEMAIPLAETFVFSSDEVYGESFNPIPLHLSKSGIVKSESPFVEVYPNPVNDKLYISSGSKILKISVFNCLGTCIREMADIQEDIHEISTRNLSPGLYILEVETIRGTTIKKFIRSKD